MAEVVKHLPQKLNFFVAAFTSIMGFALAAEIIQEDDPPDKIDDIAFLILGIFAIWWYKKNAEKKSLMPIIIVVVGTLIKLGAIFVEIADKEAVGDDIGIFVGLLITFFVVLFQYKKLK